MRFVVGNHRRPTSGIFPQFHVHDLCTTHRASKPIDHLHYLEMSLCVTKKPRSCSNVIPQTPYTVSGKTRPTVFAT